MSTSTPTPRQSPAELRCKALENDMREMRNRNLKRVIEYTALEREVKDLRAELDAVKRERDEV